MKKLFLILTLLIASELVHGQSPQSLFYLTAKEVKSKLVVFHDCTCIDSTIKYGKIQEMTFHQNNGDVALGCSFNKAGLCSQVVALYPNSQMSDCLKRINNSLIQIKPFKWRDKAETMLIEMQPVNGANLFTVKFTCIYLQ